MDGGVAEEVSSAGIIGKLVSPVDGLSAGGGKTADCIHLPASVSRQANAGGFGESGFVGIAQGNRITRGQVLSQSVDRFPVLRMKLGRLEGAGVVDPEKLAVIIMGEPPLGPMTWLFLRLPSSIGELIALHVVGNIDVIIDVPDHAGVLMLYGSLGTVSAVGTSFVEHFVFVGYSVSIGIPISHDVHGVGFPNRDPIVERKDHAGEVEVVDEDGGLVHFTIPVRVDQALDPSVAEGLGSSSVLILHIASHLRDVEGSVPVPNRENRFLHQWFGGDQLGDVSGGEFEGFNSSSGVRIA